ncbi:hypothetical protein BGZ99_010354 [Dissophora globulifera]|uniref:C2H2-type domain-containing protein n=1 Tax=Dissophora globulifera TaxID=979702 RepID=A0A9P6UMD4_9FUNG|nr:hypothetical protein BGZ99_010354 [Dissophora globulifera]
MSAPINTINQDFCLFEDDSSFDYPLFNGMASSVTAAKAAKIAQPVAASLDFFNPLCTPTTPSLDLAPAPSAVPTVDNLGFDSCAAAFLDTPFMSYMDTPFESPLVTPFMGDMALDNEIESKLAANDTLPLFSDFGAMDFSFGSAYTIEPSMLLPHGFDFKPVADVTLPSPSMSDLSSAPVSPAKSIQSDFSDALDYVSEDDDDEEYVSSRSAALVAAMKRKAHGSSDAVSHAKKMRPVSHLTASDSKRSPAPKRFSCNYHDCDRQFARLFNLHTHEKTHDPEQARPFLCSDIECGKAFSRKHDLQRHEASVHKGERNFACAKCHRPFSRQDGLRRHLAVKGPCFDNGWVAT